MLRHTTTARSGLAALGCCTLAVAALAACGGVTTRHGASTRPQPVSSVIALTAEPTPAGTPFHFNTSRLIAKAGRIEIRLINAGAVGHLVRIQSGRSCCFHGNKDLGGTQTVDPGQTTTGFVTLKPGRYFFLDPWGGFWRAYGLLTIK